MTTPTRPFRSTSPGAVATIFILTLAAVARAQAPSVPQSSRSAGAWERGASRERSAEPSIEIALRPERDTAGNVAAVAVTLQISDTASAGPTMSFRAPIVLNNIPGIADRVDGFRVDDKSGPVAITTTDDSADASGFGFYRHWRTTRALSLPATVRYRAIVPPGRLRAGPPFDLRTFAGGVSGGGAGFLAVPEDNRRYHVRIRWDLSGLQRGSVGISSLGDSDAEAVMPLGALGSSWFMAGPLGQYPEGGNTGGFSAAWLGSSPSLNIREDMEWATNTYKTLSTFFRDTVVRPYRFFLRVLPESTTSGGTAGNRSFMLQVPVRPPQRRGPEGDNPGVRSIVAHEMIHGWAGSFQGAGPWASEGLATYFTAELQRRFALQPISAFVAELNRLSRQYYANPYRNATNDAARAAFWADKNGELLPYVRGSLYFFALSAAITKASGGARSLDDVLLDLFARRSRGETVSVQTFTDALAKELGPSVPAELDSVVVRGTSTVVVPADAFGPCFHRSTTRAVVPDFAFDRRTPGTQQVVSLVSGSAAAAAGLRDGDVITTPVASDLLTSKDARRVELDVVRDGKPLRIAYTTRPMLVESYEWARVPDVPDATCRGGDR